MNSNIKSHINVIKQEGTSRYERDLWSLNPENIALDDRKLQDFIAYAQRYTKNVLFVSTDPSENDIKQESWEYFFKHDVVLLIANIATKNIKEIKKSYDRLAAQFQKQRSLGNFIDLVDYVFSRFQKLNGWYYSSLPQSSLKTDLTLYIRSYLIDDLENLQIIKYYLATLRKINYSTDDFKLELFNNNNIGEISDLLLKYNKRRSRRNDKEDSDSRDKPSDPLRNEILLKISSLLNGENIWEIKEKRSVLSGEQIFSGDKEEDKLSSAALTLDSIFEAVFHVTESINTSCNTYFEDTINGKQDHAPHIALLIAFFKLYGHVQDELNKIPRRHLDYYYREVLKIKEKHASPDQVFIVFDLAQGFENGEIKKGTELTAGKDKTGVERIYQLNEDFVINKASVASLNAISIERDKDEVLNYYSNPIVNTGDPNYLFGARQKKNITEIGFAIASTQFYLEKGERNVFITLELEEDIKIIVFDTTIIKLLLTGEKGWLASDVEEDKVKIGTLEKKGEKKIELSFSISIGQASAVVAFDEAVHTGNFKAGTPVLQCILKYPLRKPEEEPSTEFIEKISQLNVLQRMKVVKSSIMVQVGRLKPQITFDGVRDLILENHEAPLDGKKPFFPFTPMPKVGSSFYIGCKDLFYKDIDNLSINIEWMLPDNFPEYYQKYLPPYDSNKFRATLSILRNHVWKKIEDISIIDIESRDPKFRTIKLDSAKLKAENAAMEASVGSFDNTRQNYTLRLKLLYPDFGHSVYPQLITSAVMQKSSTKSSQVDYYTLVKKELRDSTFSIKLPDDLDNRSGSLRVVVYDILEHVEDDFQARIAMVKGLSRKIKEKNENAIVLPPGSSPDSGSTYSQEGGGRVVVNDDNIVERLFSLLKRIRIIPKDAHFDHDSQTRIDIIEGVKDTVNTYADFIMPSDRELEQIIINETNSAIDKSVGDVVDQLLKFRKIEGSLQPSRVADLIRKEIDEANEVINDMIARKIATLLSTRELPPPPYTPLINKISINYSSVAISKENDDRFFYLSPLGVSEIDLLQNQIPNVNTEGKQIKSNYIFPTGLVDNSTGKTDIEGMLFIGLRDIKVNQNLSLLFQLSEGTRINDKKPPDIAWWYLRNSEWLKLEEDFVVSDSTYQLQTTGIITISIPPDATSNNVLFNRGSLYWFCVSVSDDMGAFPMLVDIKTQAAVATFNDQGNDPTHLAFPLAAEQIKGLVNKLPIVKKVSQPVPSFNGKPPEQQQEYYSRTSERLRHKSRAINNWDYERLVLDNFPFLYKVKCLNNYYLGRFLIGHVTVVPITDLTNRNYTGNNVLIPKMNFLDLRKIENFLSARTSPFVKIHALNPRLDEVIVSCRVKFRSKRDRGFYLTKLNADLVTFLTPWASGDMNTLSFSSKIYASSIISFMDKREYVDYVTDFAMHQFTVNEQGERIYYRDSDELSPLEETVFTTGHSILVSAPEHNIQLIDE